jgi:hypothetical protein
MAKELKIGPKPPKVIQKAIKKGNDKLMKKLEWDPTKKK